MISSVIQNQDDIESKTTTLSKIEQVLKTTTSSKAQNAQIIKTSSKRDIISSENSNVNVQSDEYERFLTTMKKVEQIKKIQFLREQKDQK
jgi:signal recognition particle GTPase